jgi:hypothetical protein
VLREGSLQGSRGPSVATELGLLLSEQNTGTNVGGSMALIGSQRWPALTLHLNGVLSLERNRDVSALGSLIVEGPSS